MDGDMVPADERGPDVEFAALMWQRGFARR